MPLLSRFFGAFFAPSRKVSRTSPAAGETQLRQVVRARRSVPLPVVDRTPSTRTLKGKCFVIDGDTIIISGTKVRIGGIDAPELNHPYGKKSKSALINMCKGKVVTARISEEMSYDRVVASCFLPDGTDIAANLVEKGLALDWPRFSGGAYRHLEPPDARQRLWRADAKQKGRMSYVEKYDSD